jgi:hypothetical protein
MRHGVCMAELDGNQRERALMPQSIYCRVISVAA